MLLHHQLRCTRREIIKNDTEQNIIGTIGISINSGEGACVTQSEWGNFLFHSRDDCVKTDEVEFINDDFYNDEFINDEFINSSNFSRFAKF